MQQEQAYQLYIDGGATQKQIAAQTGISEKTVYNWIRQFGWHTQRQEQHERYRAISASVSTQLISCQQTITGRTESEGIPTMQELNMQVRLINCMMKLDKALSKTQQADVMTDFFEFIANNNKDLGGQVLDMYIAYAQATEIPARTNRKGPVKTSNIPETNQQPAMPDRAPITEQDHKDYRHLLGTFGTITNKHTTRFRGRFVNSRWLEYNLLQYCLPPAERRFINDARKVLTDTDHADIRRQIDQYLITLKAAA